MDALQGLSRIWNEAVTALGWVLALWVTGHALAYKRDSRAATLWVGAAWLLPLLGPVLYFLFGINRIRRWAESLRGDMERLRSLRGPAACDPSGLEALVPGVRLDVSALARAVETVAARPLLKGNRVDLLENGDAAFPAMIEAIDGAARSVTLATYIFDGDNVGRMFAAALGRAVRRGVEVRVLVDATGVRYSWPTILRDLKRERVRYARFLPNFPIWRLLTMNLRNHRKILVVDGRLGFTGGMNIRDGHWLARKPARPVQDAHFRVAGPAVAQFQEVFAEDWQFTTGESLRGEMWFPSLDEAGPVVMRGISDGPDDDLDTLRWTLLAAIGAARVSIRIATPYFLPEQSLIAALNVAAMRDVEVDILLPARSNLPLVHGASRAQWWQLLKHGCRIWLSPPPFDHSKLLVVDEAWTMVGSGNWDPRSLRLNFEFNIECYDSALARQVEQVFLDKRRLARRITLEEVDSRSLALRLMDGTARLFTPFL